MRSPCCLTILLSLLLTSPALSGDWPQILGPQRNGIAKDESLGDWQEALKTVWQFDSGSGFAGVAVVKGKVFLFHRVAENEVLDCLDAKSGKTLWQTKFPATYKGGYNADRGPRCVPVVDGTQVFVYGAGGNLHAASVADGKKLWSRGLRADYDAEDGYFGAGSTPIVSGDTVVVALGGADGAGIVGVSRSDGTTKWKGLNLEADYASPIALDDKSVIVPMRMQTVVMDAASGSVKYQIPYGQRGLNVIGATPLLIGSDLLLSASYRIGSQLVDLSTTPKVKWDRDDALSSQYASGVSVGKYVFGCHGREDAGLAELRCIEASTGDVQWSRESYGVAHVLGTEKRLIAQTVSGGLELFDASADGFKSAGTHRLPAGTYRAVPALSSGMLFCRSTDQDKGKLIAIELPE